MDELEWVPAWKLSQLMAARDLSPVELMESLLARIDRLGPDLNPFITVAADQALDGARAAEDAIARGQAMGPLHGIPVSIKDALWTKGLRTTYGSKLYEHHIPEVDSTVAARLRQAGAIIFAKTNLPEFSMNRRSLNLLSRECLTPWDPALGRTSGGSSGGSAVAVAAGLGPVSIGTDGGGSIRIPSSFNGVFGILPTRGRVPVGPRLYDLPMSGVGPISRDVRDAAITFSIIAGPDDHDWVSRPIPPPDYVTDLEAGVEGLRVAWSPDHGRIQPRRADVVDVAYEAALTLGKLGAQIDEPGLRFQNVHDPLEVGGSLNLGQSFRPSPAPEGSRHFVDFMADLQKDPARWAQLTIYMRDRSERPTQLEYAMSIPPRTRNRRIDDLEEVFQRYDIVASPVIDRPAFIAGEPGITPWEYTDYTMIANVAGYPAASVPAGFVDGLPVGLQLLAPPDREPLLFRAARALEEARPWADIRPPHA
jgi:Asp-tRNA(Asn)/Glu-tRNA(Gln) amidotransferase A subunit family amidase